MDEEMMKALEADGEKLRQLTGEDHGPVFIHDLLEFDDAGAKDDHPAKGVTVGDIRAWFDENAALREALNSALSYCDCAVHPTQQYEDERPALYRHLEKTRT